LRHRYYGEPCRVTMKMIHNPFEIIEQIDCPQCHEQLGQVVRYRGKYYLFDGAGFIMVGWKRCSLCTRVYFFQAHEYVENLSAANGNGK